MSFQQYLLEADKEPYKFVKSVVDDKAVFTIETGQIRNYRFVFKKYDDETYICELGYEKGTSDIIDIKSDFYDTGKLIDVLIDIFTGFYLHDTSTKYIIYKFGTSVNKATKLLITSIFKKDLSNYYNLQDQELKHFEKADYSLIKTSRANGTELEQDTLDDILRSI